jgi:hypothetical protein
MPDNLLERLESLERECRRWKNLAAVFGATLVLALVTGSYGILFYYQGAEAQREKNAAQAAEIRALQAEIDQLRAPAPLTKPCHPGCFPAGTQVHIPTGTQPVERVREGDLVTAVGPDGSVSPGKVASVFTTKNRLVEVRTDAGDLVTTETQPLALADGGLRAAGELQAGDRVFRWDGRERLAVTVRSVSATGREEPVFNLILGDSASFVANGFLVRSKPPAP